MKSPILAVYFRALAILELAAGVILVVISLASGTALLAPVFIALAVASALLLFGLAQIIDHVAEAAYYARLHYEHVLARDAKQQPADRKPDLTLGYAMPDKPVPVATVVGVGAVLAAAAVGLYFALR